MGKKSNVSREKRNEKRRRRGEKKRSILVEHKHCHGGKEKIIMTKQIAQDDARRTYKHSKSIFIRQRIAMNRESSCIEVLRRAKR